MLNMNKKLEQREKEGKIIEYGIAGAGQMGRDMVTRMVLMKGITPAVISDIDLELAVHTPKYAGVKDVDIVRTNEVVGVDKAMDEGKHVATTNSNSVPQCRPIEVAADVIGVLDIGAEVATGAINNKKHVVILNVETDVAIGPLLDKMAKDSGVIYTGSVGDEPGVVMEPYDFVTATGLEVKVVGKGKNNRIDKNCNPDMVLEEATRRKMSPKMLYTSKDGTKTMVEMAAMLNATGLVPDVVGGHGIASDVKSLNETYKLKRDGDTLKQHGVAEYVNGIAPGVLVIVVTDNEEIAYQMQYHSMGPGPLWALYRSYHLCDLRTPLATAKAVIDGEPTIVPKNGLVSECITVAKIDLKTGQTIDGIGGYTTYGSICKHEEAKEKGYVLYGLVNHKVVMKRDVEKGGLITYDDIEFDTTTPIYKLRQKQDKIFGQLQYLTTDFCLIYGALILQAIYNDTSSYTECL